MTYFSPWGRPTPSGQRRKRGVTLIEAVLYISIALALIVGGLSFFQQASLAQRVGSAVRNISSLAAEARALYQASRNFTGLSAQVLADAGAVPSTMIVRNGSVVELRNEWDGPVEVLPLVNQGELTTTGFRIIYEQVPFEACTRLTSFDASGSGRVGAGILSIQYRQSQLGGNGAFTFGKTIAQAANVGVTPAEASVFCREAQNNGDARSIGTDIVFSFRR